MSIPARALFEQISERIKQIDPSILELAEAKSVSYHGPGFFLEVLPRKQRLILLMPPDHAEINDPHGLARDATEWKFVTNAKYEGGVLLKINDSAQIDQAMPIIRQVFAMMTGD